MRGQSVPLTSRRGLRHGGPPGPHRPLRSPFRCALFFPFSPYGGLGLSVTQTGREAGEKNWERTHAVSPSPGRCQIHRERGKQKGEWEFIRDAKTPAGSFRASPDLPTPALIDSCLMVMLTMTSQLVSWWFIPGRLEHALRTPQYEVRLLLGFIRCCVVKRIAWIALRIQLIDPAENDGVGKFVMISHDSNKRVGHTSRVLVLLFGRSRLLLICV